MNFITEKTFIITYIGMFILLNINDFNNEYKYYYNTQNYMLHIKYNLISLILIILPSYIILKLIEISCIIIEYIYNKIKLIKYTDIISYESDNDSPMQNHNDIESDSSDDYDLHL